jgi:hypothetical protein
MHDSSPAHPATPQVFDQDTSTVAPWVQSATCPECRRGHCQNCSQRQCACPHIFAVTGRAIVELGDVIRRSAELLSEVGASDRQEDG